MLLKLVKKFIYIYRQRLPIKITQISSNIQFTQNIYNSIFFYITSMKLSKRIHFMLSSTRIPSFDLSKYLLKSQGWQDDCDQISKALHEIGVIYVKDPRVHFSKYYEFLTTMEKYFSLRSQQFDQGFKQIDVRGADDPLGLEHSHTSKYLSYKEQKMQFKPPNHSLTPYESAGDPTWRLRWILDHKNNVQPSQFPNFDLMMNGWGNSLKTACLLVAEMAAIGLKLEPSIFTSRLLNGQYYLAPTGIDLLKSKSGQVLTGFHYDYDFFTIHPSSNYSGLSIWLNNGQRAQPSVPQGHLLVHGGKQLEWVTGGYYKGSFHEVMYNQKIEKKKNEQVKLGKWPWRISSVLFCHIEGKLSIKPLEPFSNPQSNKLYPDITADQYLKNQLKKLFQETSS